MFPSVLPASGTARTPTPAWVGVRALVAVFVASLWILTQAGGAHAHSGASSLVTVSVESAAHGSTGATLQLDALLPLQELDLAYGTQLAERARQVGAQTAVAENSARLSELVQSRVSLTSAGEPWTVAVRSVTAGTDQNQDAAHVFVSAQSPSARTADTALTWRVISDQVVTHTVYLGGIDDQGGTHLVAKLTRAAPTTPLTITDPTGPAAATSDAGSWQFGLGFHHFRQGADHLLFLALVALSVSRRRVGFTVMARRLLALTLAFSVGHSVSLALAATGLVSLPTRWVETGIAMSILLAAVYAMRPAVSLRSELALAAVFGVIHGFGFAGTLQELNLHGSALVVPLLSFNLGLEAAQLAALAVVIVPVTIIARSELAARLLAGAVAAVALVWIVERAFGVVNPVANLLALLLASPERLALLLGVAAVATVAAGRRRAEAVAP